MASTDTSAAAAVFDPSSVNLDTADPAEVICYMTLGGNSYDGRIGLRISAIFVILTTSTLATMIPLLGSRKIRWLRLPLYGYLFARYFGAGVIIATAFIHLLDPGYGAIGPNTCVGMTGNWASFSWPPAIAMTSAMLLFLLDFVGQVYVEEKYGVQSAHHHSGAETALTGAATKVTSAETPVLEGQRPHVEANPDIEATSPVDVSNVSSTAERKKDMDLSTDELSTSRDSSVIEKAFAEQISAFLILEIGVVFHSVLIGLNLAVAGSEVTSLYPVIVFHQTFEGLGIGARMSAIPFPRYLRAMPWMLCVLYGLTTPVAIAIGLGLRTTYTSGSFTANVVSGIFDSISAGILLYTGLVELLARDFLFNPERTRDKKRITFMLVCLFLGTGVMALLGKWA